MLGRVWVPRMVLGMMQSPKALQTLCQPLSPLHHSHWASKELSTSLAHRPLAGSATLVFSELCDPPKPVPNSCFSCRIPASPAISRCPTGSSTRQGRTTSITCECGARAGWEVGGVSAGRAVALPNLTSSTEPGAGPGTFPQPCPRYLETHSRLVLPCQHIRLSLWGVTFTC